ncbi:MAG TPA: hypothetical protein VFQ20_05270 [Burkholderiaceae bacterium]|nr:hypothetical protein [Burkholderiaceae bacterium]
MARKLRGEGIKLAAAAHDRRRLRSARAPPLQGSRRCGAGRRHGFDGNEPVAAPRHGRYRLRTQVLAQRADLRCDVVLFDHHAGPHGVQEFLLRHHAVASLGQGQQQVEGARTERGRHAIDAQHPFVRADLDAAEAERATAARGRQVGRV